MSTPFTLVPRALPRSLTEQPLSDLSKEKWVVWLSIQCKYWVNYQYLSVGTLTLYSSKQNYQDCQVPI